jgi:hypothetical protein
LALVSPNILHQKPVFLSAGYFGLALAYLWGFTERDRAFCGVNLLSSTSAIGQQYLLNHLSLCWRSTEKQKYQANVAEKISIHFAIYEEV